uniref:Carcinoembryonic antigen-related cell adhesion molecule 5 n=1 Tax=Lygus hesperus TaxID=30085 RepID=A0A0A9WGU1_LYGHE
MMEQAYPMDAPIISGLKTHYHAGEYIEAQCTAPPSYPAPEMSWAINGKGVDTYKTSLKVNEDRGLLRATLSVKLMADAGLFKNPGGYALFVCTSILMDTPAMSADSKVYWSTEPESTEANSDLDSSGDIFRNSNAEGDYTLKEEPPDRDENENEIEKSRSVTRNSGEDETSHKIVIKKGAQRSRDLPSSGSRNGFRLVPICLSAISLLQGHLIHYLRAV